MMCLRRQSNADVNDNSPTFQRWGRIVITKLVPKGRLTFTPEVLSAAGAKINPVLLPLFFLLPVKSDPIRHGTHTRRLDLHRRA